MCGTRFRHPMLCLFVLRGSATPVRFGDPMLPHAHPRADSDANLFRMWLMEQPPGTQVKPSEARTFLRHAVDPVTRTALKNFLEPLPCYYLDHVVNGT